MPANNGAGNGATAQAESRRISRRGGTLKNGLAPLAVPADWRGVLATAERSSAEDGPIEIDGVSMQRIAYDLGAEEAVIGSLLLDRDAIIKVRPFLRQDDFFRPQLGAIYQAISDLYDQREPPDLVILSGYIERMPFTADQTLLEALGGVGFLAALMGRTPTAVHVEYYATRVFALSVLRIAHRAGCDIAALGYELDRADFPDAATKIRERAFDILTEAFRRTAAGGGSELRDISSIIAEKWDQIVPVPDAHGYTGVPVFSAYLNGLAGNGLKKGDLYVVGGYTGVGKTAFLCTQALYAARLGYHVGIYSLEMGEAQLVQRFLAQMTQIELIKIVSGTDYLTDEEYNRLVDAASELSTLPISMSEKAAQSVLEMLISARAKHAQKPLDMLIVDYIQLMKDKAGGRGNNELRYEEIGSIVMSLKDIGRQLDIPVLAAAQLKDRDELKRGEFVVPSIHDFREGASIQHAATAVYLLARDILRPDRMGDMLIINGKNRVGPPSGRWYEYKGPILRLVELADGEQRPMPWDRDKDGIPALTGGGRR
jgi:replicative DNA helicase